MTATWERIDTILVRVAHPDRHHLFIPAASVVVESCQLAPNVSYARVAIDPRRLLHLYQPIAPGEIVLQLLTQTATQIGGEAVTGQGHTMFECRLRDGCNFTRWGVNQNGDVSCQGGYFTLSDAQSAIEFPVDAQSVYLIIEAHLSSVHDQNENPL